MLAYRHAFHAGNHADVLKHLILVEVLHYMSSKDKGVRLVDTHAGAGAYALSGRQAAPSSAQHQPEFLDGIGRLWARDDAPPAVQRYVSAVRTHNPRGTLKHYPGSPALAALSLRPQDQLRLYELHPADVEALAHRFAGMPQVEVHRADGFGAVRTELPPPTRRAVVLMDPPYEMKADYSLVVASVREALKRFADCVLIVWYPLIARVEARQLPQRLKGSATKGWLHASLSVAHADARGVGLMGSGVFVFNPPWTLHESLQETLPWLCETLAQREGASWLLEQHAV